MSEDAIVTVYAVFGSEEEASSISRMIVEERLAACANLLAPCRSFYRWQGRIEDDQEYPALFKTRAEVAPLLIARIDELHSYDVPAAVAWPIAEAHVPYALWVAEETDPNAT